MLPADGNRGTMTPKIHFTASEAEMAQQALPVLSALYGTVDLDQADVVVALGGDGFMLQTLHSLTGRGLPVYGMNRGTVGFLMNGFAEEGLLERLDAAREVVTISDDIMGGTPVISGTRVPVHDVAAALAAGVPAKEILEDYPSLTEDRLELAALYAEANPLRGRPKPLIARLPEGARILSDHRVPRRRAG